MKKILIILFVVTLANARVLQYNTEFENLEDGDTLDYDLHLHMPLDSIKAAFNGGFSNANLADTAKIRQSKIDSVYYAAADWIWAYTRKWQQWNTGTWYARFGRGAYFYINDTTANDGDFRIYIDSTKLVFLTNDDSTWAQKFTADTAHVDTLHVGSMGIACDGGISGTTGTFTSTVGVDSLRSTKGIKATTGTFTSTVSADSVFSTKGVKGTRFTGAVTGDVTGTADSAKGAHHLTGGAVSATSGSFSNTVTVNDSITISAANSSGNSGKLRFESSSGESGVTDLMQITSGAMMKIRFRNHELSKPTLYFDLRSGIGYQSVLTLDTITATFASTVNADSIFSTKSVKGTNGIFSGDVYTTDWTTFNPATIGWAATPTVVCKYKTVGDIIYVCLYVTGTSNTTTAKIQLPVTNGNAQKYIPLCGADNGTALATWAYGSISALEDTIVVYADPATTAWTNSGTKEIKGTFWYESGNP